MMNDNYCGNISKNEYRKSLVHNFPYSELSNVSPSNLIQIRKCLPYLLEIVQNDLVFTNLKAVKCILEFATTTLSSFDNVYARDIFVELLILLKETLLRLTTLKKLGDVFYDMNVLADVLLYVSDLDIFCTYCANICQPILQLILKTNKNDYNSVDQVLAGILENFKKIKADNEVAIISEVILLRFPLESQAYQLSAYWLMEDSIQILKDVQVENIEDESRLITIIRNIYTFINKVSGLVSARSEMVKYYESTVQFVNDLKNLSPKLIRLCCKRSTGSEAKKLLGIVLQEFLREQGIMTHDVERIINEEIEKFPLNLKNWPNNVSRTFFWICHLLYYHKRYLEKILIKENLLKVDKTR